MIGTIALLVRMGEERFRVFFGIVRHLAIPVLLETAFTYKVARGIFPDERKIAPHNSEHVVIMVTFGESDTEGE